MCGIFGIKRIEDDSGNLAPPILQAQIDLGLNSIEYRGNDAAGVALISLTGEIFVHKNNEPAWDLTGKVAYRDFMAEHLDENIVCVLAHTRKATKGNPFRNPNNHPLIKDAGVVIHNGMISNDDSLFQNLKLERGAETDSDILRALLDASGGVNKDAIKELNRVIGSVASALAHPADPTKLLLLRSGNPLVCADDGEKFYFASDKRAIYRAARPWIERHGIPMQLQAPNIAFVTMPNDTAWIIGAKGLEWHDKFNSSSIRWRYTSYGEVYSPNGRIARRAALAAQAEAQAATEHQASSQEENQRDLEVSDEFQVESHSEINGASHAQINYVKCPSKECHWLLALSEDQQKIPLTKLRCPKCRTNLSGAIKSTRLVQRETQAERPVVN